MSKSTNNAADEYEVLRLIVGALEKLPTPDQQRVLRWAQEKLGLPRMAIPSSSRDASLEDHSHEQPSTAAAVAPAGTVDIKTFIATKNPLSDMQFGATVAYYYRFAAPAGVQKQSITAEDLQDACRQTGWEKFTKTKARQTLINAYHQGLLERGERGAYMVSTVGENLVAVALPATDSQARPRNEKRKRKGKKSSKGRVKRARA